MTRQFWLGFEAGAVATLCVTITLSVMWIVSLMHRKEAAQPRRSRDKRWSAPR